MLAFIKTTAVFAVIGLMMAFPPLAVGFLFIWGWKMFRDMEREEAKEAAEKAKVSGETAE